eukprot:3160818-Prymnesium_polylepis.1
MVPCLPSSSHGNPVYMSPTSAWTPPTRAAAKRDIILDPPLRLTHDFAPWWHACNHCSVLGRFYTLGCMIT